MHNDAMSELDKRDIFQMKEEYINLIKQEKVSKNFQKEYKDVLESIESLNKDYSLTFHVLLKSSVAYLIKISDKSGVGNSRLKILIEKIYMDMVAYITKSDYIYDLFPSDMMQIESEPFKKFLLIYTEFIFRGIYFLDTYEDILKIQIWVIDMIWTAGSYIRDELMKVNNDENKISKFTGKRLTIAEKALDTAGQLLNMDLMRDTDITPFVEDLVYILAYYSELSGNECYINFIMCLTLYLMSNEEEKKHKVLSISASMVKMIENKGCDEQILFRMLRITRAIESLHSNGETITVEEFYRKKILGHLDLLEKPSLFLDVMNEEREKEVSNEMLSKNFISDNISP